ncbi:MAG: PqqD family peptide modification chaperone [Candidatus Thermoplasmatota archaeon]
MERIPDASRQVAEPTGDVVVTTDGHGLVTVRRRRFGPVRTRIARALGVAPDFTIRLDRLGSQAWGLLDGQRTVGEVHAELARRLPDEKDLAARLGKFLGTMVSRNMLRLR